MKLQYRNLQPFYYMLFEKAEPIKTPDGLETGTNMVKYYPAVSMKANISAASGSAQVEQFGNFSSYDKVILTDDMNCPIDENTVLFVDKQPEYTDTGEPLYDYVVRRVAKSLNNISYAISKVEVS